MGDLQTSGLTVLQPTGRLGLDQASGLVEKIRAAEAGVRLDLSRVDIIEVSMLQVILVAVASLRSRGKTIVVNDSDRQILRSTLRLSGIHPELAGLSASLTL